MSSTLWTVIETGDLRSPSFPCRIIEPDLPNSVVFTGVDTSGLLRSHTANRSPPHAYRILWRTEPDREDPNPQRFVALPLGKAVTLTFSHGNSSFLSLAVAGVDVVCSFDVTTRTLSTSWFTPPFSTSWTLEAPRRIMNRLLSGIKPLLQLTDTPVEDDGPTSPKSYCCRLW